MSLDSKLNAWLDEDRFREDRTLFLQQDFELPTEANLCLLELSSPQLCMLALQPDTPTLTRMRARAQFIKRRKKFVFDHSVMDLFFVDVLHLLDMKYEMDNMASLTPAQLLGVGVHKDSTPEKRANALLVLQVLLISRKKPPKKGPNPLKRSHSPTLEEAMIRAKEAKREISPNLLDSSILPPRPIAPSPDSQIPSLAAADAQAGSGLMAWVNPDRFAQVTWDPRLFLRQIDFAVALGKRTKQPRNLPPFSPSEFAALKFSPNRPKLPVLPDAASSGCPDPEKEDREVLSYLYKEQTGAAQLSWLLAGPKGGFHAYVDALRKVTLLRNLAAIVWTELEREISSAIDDCDPTSEPLRAQVRLVRELQDEAELADFFCRDGKLIDYPLPHDLRDKVGDRAWWKVRDFAKHWNRWDH